MIRLEPRGEPSAVMVWATPVIAALLTILAGTLLFAALGFPPLRALHAFFIAPVSSLYGLAELGVKATPLALIAVGLGLLASVVPARRAARLDPARVLTRRLA